MGDKPIEPVPPPWKLKGFMYVVNFYCKAGNLPDYAYSPLEKDSSFAGPESGKHVGGIGQFHLIRYTESPVGPYDELIIAPGNFQYDLEENGRRKAKKNLRITRIYVSQKYTCWNGRRNWNIPKHLARFEWEELPQGTTRVKVFPYTPTNGPEETPLSDKPLFQVTFQPIRFVPSFPLNFSWAKYVGLDPALVQPPLPEGKGFEGELAGTEQWCKIVPDLSSKKTSLGWADLSQGDGSVTPFGEPIAAENFWPDTGRWQLALKLENADIAFDDGVHWDAPKTNL